MAVLVKYEKYGTLSICFSAKAFMKLNPFHFINKLNFQEIMLEIVLDDIIPYFLCSCTYYNNSEDLRHTTTK